MENINFVTMGYRVRLYPTDEQKILINKTFGCCRVVYNKTLARKKELWESNNHSLSKCEAIKSLPTLKADEEFSWLSEVDSVALQASIENLFRAYDNFFKSVKNKDGKFSYPKFKSKKNRQSYTTKNTHDCIKVIGKSLQLPKLGFIKFRCGKEIIGKIKRVTVTRDNDGKYYASITCENVPYKMHDSTGSVVGIDLGIKSLVTTSDGIKSGPCNKYRKSLQRLKRSQRRMSRKPIGSKNREKQRIIVAKQSRKVKNQRNDFQHKLSRQLVNDYDLICVETLNTKGMLKNHKLAQSIQDSAFSSLIQKITYKAEWEKKVVVKIDRFYPSSKRCNCCGFVNHELTLGDREWVCPECGTRLDRDMNAAKNILEEGLRIFNS